MSGIGLLGRIAWSPAAGARPTRGLSYLHSEAVVPASLDETFAFFSDARNLEKLTPPWVNFDIRTTGDMVMREGSLIDYRIVLYGIPVPWQTRIDVWEPGVRFVDRQVRGPYRWWNHEHRFETVAGGTRVIDDVEYVPRARWISGALVRRDVARIFAYRQQALATLFAR